ncbi:MAG: SRPBCC domain-containing protein [Acidimicrobiia bacterium]|nr:SRPBCC domain-containing protein [Acidimicrobiia bacterium]MDX2467051.1 SRPBCC domain-containing protein [Acidimicrobiia bacterium]
MTEYAVARTINAPVEKVWALLTDAAGYTMWNPTIVSLEGNIAVGERISLVSTVNPKRAFKLNVVEMSPQKMVWSDGMPLGLFKGERTFTVTPTTGGGTEFSMREVYSGFLAPLITKTIPDMTDSFEEFATGLKNAAEDA